MKCPVCIQQNTKSRVRDTGSMKTLMACSPFYDGDGRRHHHDSNTTTTGFHCSNGHTFSVAKKGSCLCGWGKDVKPHVVVFEGPGDTTVSEPLLSLMFAES